MGKKKNQTNNLWYLNQLSQVAPAKNSQAFFTVKLWDSMHKESLYHILSLAQGIQMCLWPFPNRTTSLNNTVRRYMVGMPVDTDAKEKQ